MTYSLCESQFARSQSPWHIRQLTEAGMKLGGGADTLALCGHKVDWDLSFPIQEHIKRGNVCERCEKIMLERRAR